MKRAKTILIISQEADKSTDDVIKYLKHFKASFLRVNDVNIIADLKIEIGNYDSLQMLHNNAVIDINDVTAVWYRRGLLNFLPKQIDEKLDKVELLSYQQYFDFYRSEIKYINDYINDQLRKIKHINSPDDNNINKIRQLAIAKRNGLIIPETFITDSLSEVEGRLQYGPVILKAINFHVFNVRENDKNYTYATDTSVLITKENFADLSLKYIKNKFFISFYQQYIEKKIEIRTFFLYGKFYSMAIFSQGNENTKVDYRNYDYSKPNRTVPYKLPDDLEDKITKFMAEMQLDCGSLDIIYSINGNYYFLEVNPVGQFDWLNKECNYYLDKLIAEELTYDLR